MAAALKAGKQVVTKVAKEKAKEKVAKVVTSKFKKKKSIPIKADKLLGEKKGGPLALRPKGELVPSMKGQLTPIPEAQPTVDIQKFVGKEVKPVETGKDKLGLDIITKTLDSIVESIDQLKDSLSDRTKDSKIRLKKQLNALKIFNKRSREKDLESDKDKSTTKKKKGFNLAPEFDFLKTIGRYLKYVLIGTLVNGLFTGNQLIIKTFRIGILAYFAAQKIAAQFVANIVKTISKSLRAVTRPFRAMGRLITRAFRNLGKAIFGWVDDAVKMLWRGIKNLGGGLLKGAKNLGGGLLKGAKNVIGAGKNLLGKGIKAFSQTGVGKTIGNVIGKGKNLLGKGVKAFGKTAVGKTVGNVIGKGKNLLGKGVKLFKGLKGKGILGKGKDLLGKGLKAFSKTGLGKTLGNVIGKGKNLLGKGVKLFKGLKGKNLLGKGKDLLGKGIKAFSKTGVGKTIGNVIGKGKGLLSKGKGFLSKGKGLLSKGAKALGKTGAAKTVGKVSSTLAKWFGPGVAKMMSKAKPLFKTIAKGAKKGIKIPFLGPILVAITSILAGEPIGKILFKTAGTAIGGTLGMALAAGLTTATAGLGALVSPALMIVGEMVGEFLGNALYDLTLGGGIGKAIGAVKDKVGEAIMKVINIPKWIGDSTKRFFTNFPSIKVPAKLGLQSILGKIPPFSFFAKEGGVAGKRVTKLPDLSLFIPILGLPKLLKHLKNSFFPPKGGDAVGGGGEKGGSGSSGGIDDKGGKGKTLTSKKKVSSRFDFEKGKGFINEKEVEADEYLKFQELSKKEQLDQYGVDPTSKSSTSKSDSDSIAKGDSKSISKTNKVDTESLSSQTSYEQASNTIVLMQPPTPSTPPEGGGTKTVPISPNKISLVNSQYEMSNTIKSYAL